ncbi:MAG: hypothetical protein JWN24_1367 [Phycisphaerales bacterium]|nr:hypothetical protein [Phycisphaerales bacterium]
MAEKSRDRHREQDGGESDDLAARMKWFFASRSGAKGKPLTRIFYEGSRQRRRIEFGPNGAGDPPQPPGPAGTVNWTPLGPTVVAHGQATANQPVSGRITSIVAGPNGSRAYAGAANGGVWLTNQGGTIWAPLDDYSVSPSSITGATEADSLAVGAIAVRFGAAVATDLVYVGTGEANSNFDAYFGVGIKRSASGGAAGTWTLEATNLAGRGVFKIVIDPDDPTKVFAATTAGLFQRPAAAPFTNWTQVTSVFSTPNGRVTDLVVAGTGATRAYYCVFQGDKAYTSTNGTAWTVLSGLPAGGRVALAVAESSPTIAYAFKQDGTLYRLVGTTFQAVAGVAPAINYSQGWYDLTIAVDPSNANTVYLLGDTLLDLNTNYTLSMFKSTITGGVGAFNFGFNPANAANPTADPTFIGRNVHADGHAICFALNAAGTAHDGSDVWVGTDGGIFRSTSSGALGTFSHRNTGLAITEMTFLGQRVDTDALVYAGCQDNGNLRFWGEPAWYEAPQGDGGGVAIDPNDEYQVMRQYVRACSFYQNPPGTWNLNSALSASTDGGATGSWSGLKFPPITDPVNNVTVTQRTAATNENNATAFYAPIAVSPAGVAPTLAAFGTNRLWLTTDFGATWTTLPTNTNPYAAAGGPNAAQDVLDGTSVTSVAFASGTRIFASTSNAVWRFDNPGGGWAPTAIPTAGLPAGRFITDLAVHDAAAGTFYIALGGGGFDHTWFFDGAAWHSAGLAAATLDVPCHAIVVDPDHPDIVYLGSDVGVWKGTKTGATSWTWALFSPGLPEAAVTDLAVQSRARLLRAATHGRGVWEIALDAASGTDPDLYLRVNYADTGRVLGGARYSWVENHQDPTAKGFQVYHWMSPDVKVHRPSLGGPTVSSPPDLLDFSANIGDYIDTSDIETADEAGLNRIFIQVHNRALTPVAGTDVRVLLLLTDAAAGLPPLPADYATRIISGDTSNWLTGSSWRFADPMTPYRTLPGTIEARVSQVVYYDFDFSTMALPAGHNHVCAAALVTTISSADRLLSPGNTSMDALTMIDKHVAHRNLHLVPAGAMPAPPPAAKMWKLSPQTVVLDFHNPQRQETEIDIVLDRRHFAGEVTMMLPKLELRQPGKELDGWRVQEIDRMEAMVIDHTGGFLKRLREAIEELGEKLELTRERIRHEPAMRDEREIKLRKLITLDRTRLYVADAKAASPTISGVRLPAHGRMTAAITVRAPDGAKPGERFRFDVLQRQKGRIVGGSTYVLTVFDASGTPNSSCV